MGLFGKKNKKEDVIDAKVEDTLEESKEEASDDLKLDIKIDEGEDKVITPEEINAENEAIKALKEEKKEEKKEYKREHGVKANFSRFKFIIKIVIFAILVVFAILMFVFKDEMIGAVYLVSGIAILSSAIIRLIPLLKTTKSGKARLILLVELLIHMILGAYLIVAAFYHWDKLHEYALKVEAGEIAEQSELKEKLDAVSGGWFAKFNTSAYAYILVAFFYTLAIPYYWVTILYNEKTRRSLFWLQTIAITIALFIGIFADKLEAEQLVITLAILALIGALVIGGEAAGGYMKYRKNLAASNPKTKSKEKGIEAPAKEDKNYTDIDPNSIPKKDEDQDSSVIM